MKSCLIFLKFMKGREFVRERERRERERERER